MLPSNENGNLKIMITMSNLVVWKWSKSVFIISLKIHDIGSLACDA
jgi:hypothetical protein